MQERQIKYITSSTEDLHREVAEAYENMMDGENEKAIATLKRIQDKTKALKDDLTIKD